MFHRQQQGANETIAEYMAELRRLASTCEFRDRLVYGLRHEATRRRLLTKSTLTLTKAFEIAQSLEGAEQNSKKI